ncbi:MAG: thioredoxin family protein [Planctomycetia bacterium]|nr:thioredoxin family protein [Planctomycetia bacterium]
MTRKYLSLALVAFVAAGCASAALAAAKFNKKLEVGAAPSAWKDLPGTDGKSHSLADYKDAKLLVVIFTTNTCPVAIAYEDRLVALQKEFSPKGVQLVAINCNPGEDNNLAAMKERASQKQFNFPYLYDEAQQSGRNYGATCTPHVFILDANRKVAYMGAIDDNMSDTKVKRHYLSDALTALLAGNAPPELETRQFGCGIHYQ